MKEEKNKLTTKRIIYTFCFMLFCVINQIRGSMDGATQMAAVNCTGLLMGIIILSAYKWQDFKKPAYLVWMIIFAVGGTIACFWGKKNYPYFGQWVTGVLNIGIFGIIVIRLFYKLKVEKDYPKINYKIFAIWSIMLVLMAVSRDRSLWPLWFLVMFGSFYLTVYSEDEKDALYDGMLNGLIAGFFLIQGGAFVFRPYDAIRYLGMFANPNINGLFYSVSCAAFLGKWYRLQNKGSALIWRILCAFFVGAMYGFAFLTMCKTALLTMAVVTVFFLLAISYGEKKNKALYFLRTGGVVVLTFIICFPVVFAGIRYLPAVFHHPVWFPGEYHEGKVHSWDPVDSEKYIDFDEFWNNSFARVFWFMDTAEWKIGSILTPGMTVHAAELDTEILPEAEMLEPETLGVDDTEKIEPGSDPEHPVLTDPEDAANPWMIRWGIHQYYLKRLNLWGHGKEEQQGFWLTAGYLAPHAHNIFIDLTYHYGILAGICFLGLVIGLIGKLGIQFFKAEALQQYGGWRALACFEVIMVTVVFGMLEMDWTVGQNTFTLLFVVMEELHQKLPD